MPETTVERLLQGKRAIVTGAGKGIGREIAEHFALAGANLCVVSRSSEDVMLLSKEIQSKYPVKCLGVAADVASKDECKAAVEKANQALGGVDILVCAAGYPLLADVWDKKLHEFDESDFLKVFNIDVLGSFRMLKHVIPLMMKNAKGGAIILFSSTPAIAGYDKGAPYTTAKAANLGLVRDLASEYGQQNIRAYAVAPGNIETARTFEQLSAEDKEKLANESSMKRWGKPEEVAEVVVALASEKMSFVTGQTIVVDGGTVML